MLISQEEATKRLNSPMNLFNKVRENNHSPSRSKAMQLFGVGIRKLEETIAEDREIRKAEKSTPSNFLPAAPESDQQSIGQKSIESESATASQIPVITPEVLASPGIDNILDNVESRLKLELIHNEALDTLVQTIKAIKISLPELTKADKLAAVAVQLNKVVESIRGERNKTQGNKEVHLHFYTPTQKKVTDYRKVAVNA